MKEPRFKVGEAVVISSEMAFLDSVGAVVSLTPGKNGLEDQVKVLVWPTLFYLTVPFSRARKLLDEVLAQ